MKLIDGNDVLLIMKKIIPIVSIVIVTIGSLYLCFWFGQKTQKPIVLNTDKGPVQGGSFEIKNNVEENNWIRPKSNKIGFAFAEKDKSQTEEPYKFIYGKLFIWIMDENKMIDTKIIVYNNGFTPYGYSTPMTSPDRLYTAYIDTPNQKLNIISHETLDKKIISTSRVENISGWSSDSSKIVYFIEGSKNIVTNKTETRDMEGGDWMVNEIFDKDIQSGFYMFDLKTGKTTFLYPLTTFDSFIDSKRILSEVEYYDYDNKRHEKLVIFDTETFEANYSTFKEDVLDNGNSIWQYDYTKDLSKWVYAYQNWKNDNSKVEVRLANWPDSKGERVSLGERSQRPKFSPDGSKIAYCDGTNIIQLYDIATKNTISLANGGDFNWMDNKNILIGKSGVVNIETKELKPIPLIE